MMTGLVAAVAMLFVLTAAIKARGWWTRTQAVAAIPADAVVRHVENVTMRVLVQGTRSLPGMSTRYANRTRGDLVLTDARFVLATNRGVIADLTPLGGRRFTSVRCTGPGRLVIEGDVPGSRGGRGLYRVEVPIPDALAWAEALQPYVRDDGAGVRRGWAPPGP